MCGRGTGVASPIGLPAIRRNSNFNSGVCMLRVVAIALVFLVLPVISGAQGLPPETRNVLVTTQEGVAATGALTATDPSGGPVIFSIITPPTSGTIAVDDAATGAFTYTPRAGAVGYDRFTFRATGSGGASLPATAAVFIVASSPRWPGQTVRASVASDGAEGNDSSVFGAIASADGRFIAFNSAATNLAPGDTNAALDVFVHDRATGQTSRISVAGDGAEANDLSLATDISPDGRYVAFTSAASNLVPGDTNGQIDAFVHDRQTGLTTRISVATDGTQGNNESVNPVMSADGRFVAFYGLASNLVPGDTNGDEDVFLHDRQTGQTTRLSVSSVGAQGDSNSWRPAISADGRYVAFQSEATNLVAGDTNGAIDVFVRDRVTGQTTRASVTNSGGQAGLGGGDGVLSADGRYVTFVSRAGNLVAGDTNGAEDVFVRDRQTGQTTRVSVGTGGVQGNGFSTIGYPSADARYIVFQSFASNLVAGDTNNAADVFVHDRQTGETVRVSVASDGAQGNAASEGNTEVGSGPAISDDGRTILFPSRASNLVGGDTNTTEDIFVAGPVSVNPAVVQVAAAGGVGSLTVEFDYPGTPWAAATTAPWITIVPPIAGSSNGAVTFTVAPNSRLARTGTIVAALQTVTVLQEATSVPVAHNGALTTAEDTAFTGSLAATDSNGDDITFSVVTQPAHGTAVIVDAATGSFTYTPALDFNGTDSFTFRATAGGEVSEPAIVLVAVTPVSDAPVAIAGTLAAVEDATATGTLAGTDADGNALTFGIVTPPTHGIVVITNPSTGAYSYTPEPNYNGNDVFRFSVSDGTLGSNVAAVAISVAPADDAPVANSVVVTTQQGTARTGVLPASDIDGGAVAFSVVTAPTKGTLVIDDASTGAFTFTPNAGAIGYDTFTFRAANGDGASSTASGMVFIVASSPAWPGQTVRVNVASDGTPADRASSVHALSADGRYVVFDSAASNLVPGDTNGINDIFVRDRRTGLTTRVSVGSGGEQLNGGLADTGVDISADGRYVAFTSIATSLVAGDTNGAYDNFVHDRETHQTTRISLATDGSQGNSASFRPRMSADGRYIAFYSLASNLVADDTNGMADVFVHDRLTRQTTRVSVASDGTQGNAHSLNPAISADGRYAVFNSQASNLVPGDTNAIDDVFVHDRRTGETTRVSVRSDGAQGAGGASIARATAISADGRYVAFLSRAALVSDDTNGEEDVFVHDRQTAQMSRVSVANDGAQAAGRSDGVGISADGRFVAFLSTASNLVDGDTNARHDVFVRDRLTSRTVRVNVSTDGVHDGGAVRTGTLSSDGRYVTFTSFAPDLVPGDTNNSTDIFVVGGVTVSPETVAVPSAGGTHTIGVSFDYPGTPWTASTTTPWITINAPAGGSTNGTVNFSVAPNFGPARIGTIVAALHTVSITQEAFVDVTAPVVTAPAPITVYATTPLGAPASVPAIGPFLMGATAADDGPSAPLQLSTTLNGVAITSTTVFAIGPNVVTFSFSDAAGHVGTATSVVTVVAGRPQLSVSLASSVGSPQPGQRLVSLRVINNGTGYALNASAALGSLRTLMGSGAVTLVSGLPAVLPNLAPGETTTIQILLNVPATVRRFAITEGFTVNDHTGTLLTSTFTQTIFP